MITLRSAATALVAGMALLVPASLAHSVKRNPVSHISLIEDAVIHSPSHLVNAFSTFDLVFTLHDGAQRVRLALEPNHDLLDPDFAITHLNQDGSVREVNKVPRSEDKVYRGSAFIHRPGVQGWSKAGWARVSVHRDGQRPLFDGAFRIDGDAHHVLSRADYQATKDERDPDVDAAAADDAMVMWRDSDVVGDDADSQGRTELRRGLATGPTCDADALSFNSRLLLQSDRRRPLGSTSPRSLFGRQIDDGGDVGTGLDLLSSIGSTAGCPTTKKVALVGIATDCNYFSALNSTSAVKKQIVSIVNRASEIYESTFRISLAIKNLTIIDKACAGSGASASTPWNVGCGTGMNLGDRLNAFSQWRSGSEDENAYWTLFTTCATETAVGLAWRGMACRTGASSSTDGSGNNETVAATNVVVRTDTEWQVFAHESGHTFGAVHDCVEQTCPTSEGSSQACCPLSRSQCDAQGRYMMNPSTGAGITAFSPCSIGNICSGFRSNMIKSSCLRDNRNVQTDVDVGSVCGNGIVESGEECDCGGDNGCKDNKCCDAKTCKLTAGSVCDPSNDDCCAQSCGFAPAGTVCRPSTGDCDVAETCPGDKAACPEDRHSSDGDACGDGLACASGQCTSRDLQCRHMASSLTGRNDTTACPDTQCMLACTSPDMPPNQCVAYNQFFVDGTGCGAGGHCRAGSCEGSSALGEAGQWIDNHKSVFIPIVVVVGLLVLAAIASCLSGVVRRLVRARRATASAPTHPPPQQGGNPDMSAWSSGGPHGANNQPWMTMSGAQQPYQQQPMYPQPPPMAADPSRWGNQQSARYA